MSQKKVKSRKEPDKDFSNRTVVILLVLVIIMSLISAVLYLSVIDSVNAPHSSMQNHPQAQGVASLTITPHSNSESTGASTTAVHK